LLERTLDVLGRHTARAEELKAEPLSFADERETDPGSGAEQARAKEQS
jgi:hypothetical protein